LGVLLYELVTGCTPFDAESFRNSGVDEIRRRIREHEPPRPSTRLNSLEKARRIKIAEARQVAPDLLHKSLHSEIDWIIMKAIDKDRSRRYHTTEGLARDIERFLEGSAVEACPPTATYRLRKLVRRHRASFAFAASIFAVLLLGAIVATIQALRIGEANDRANQLLWDSYLVQAKATIKAPELGRRHATLEAIAKAAAIQPSTDLRNEAIAAMAWPDLRPIGLTDLSLPRSYVSDVDPSDSHYVVGTPDGQVVMYEVEGRRKLFALPDFDGPVTQLMFSPDGSF